MEIFPSKAISVKGPAKSKLLPVVPRPADHMPRNNPKGSRGAGRAG